MITQVFFAVLGVVCTSVAFPRTYQEQRQVFYPQPFPVHQQLVAPYQVPSQRVQYQVPAATSLLPNNVNTGLRYGQQQLVYVVPAGSQVYFDEQGGQEGENGGYIDGVINLWNGVSGYFPSFGGSTEKPQEGGAGGETPAVEKPVEEKPEKLEQKPIENANAQESAQQPQQQQQQQQQQRYYVFGQPQQYFAPRPAVAAPSQNLYLYKNYQQLAADHKPGNAALGFQRLLQKNPVEKPTIPEKEGESNQEESSDHDQSNEELGPSIAQAKPQAVSVAGPGGVAAAAPVGTAIVGPGGMALSAPTATAVAGTKPGKPSDKDKVRSYFPRTSFYHY